MARDADIVVVGAGIVGAAAARALARAFATLVLGEQDQLGHDPGASHGPSRIFRRNYPQARYVRRGRAGSDIGDSRRRSDGLPDEHRRALAR